MLLFELFPLFMAVLSVVIGLWLVMVDRQAKQDPTEHVPRKVPPPRAPGDRDSERGGRRPSMSA